MIIPLLCFSSQKTLKSCFLINNIPKLFLPFSEDMLGNFTNLIIEAVIKKLLIAKKINVFRRFFKKISLHIKGFKSFGDVSKPITTINAIEIDYGFIYKRASKPMMKGSRVNLLKLQENSKENYKKVWRKSSIYNHYL